MKCSKCGQDYDGNFCPNCGTPAPGNADTPKKKKKFHWWYVLIVILILGVIGSIGGDEEEDTEGQPQQKQEQQTPDENAESDEASESSTGEAEQPPAPSKETAESNDLMIYTTLEMAERYLGVLQDAINGLGDGSATMLDVYNTCEDVKQYMMQFDDHLDEVVDESAASYKDAVHGYIILLWGAADSLMDYIDDNEMSDLSDAQDSIEALTPQVYLTVSERMAYLSNSGFSDEEIQAILEESANEGE